MIKIINMCFFAKAYISDFNPRHGICRAGSKYYCILAFSLFFIIILFTFLKEDNKEYANKYSRQSAYAAPE